LENLYSLTLGQGVHHNRTSIRESKSIVVLAKHLGRYLAELRNVIVDRLGLEPTAAIFDVSFERQLSTRQKADGDTFLCGRGKAQGPGTAKAGGY
jgi:hypothetical protein